MEMERWLYPFGRTGEIVADPPLYVEAVCDQVAPSEHYDPSLRGKAVDERIKAFPGYEPRTYLHGMALKALDRGEEEKLRKVLKLPAAAEGKAQTSYENVEPNEQPHLKVTPAQ